MPITLISAIYGYFMMR